MRRRTTTPVLITTLALALPLPAAGQALGQSPPREPNPNRRPLPPEPGTRLVDMQFRGGTAAEYVELLKRVAAGSFNVVVAAEASEVTVPSVELRQVTPASALRLLDGRMVERPGRRVRLDVKALPPQRPDEVPTFQIDAEVRFRERGSAAHVWTIRELVANGFASEAILSAVETALDAVGSETPLDVRFHEETGLLIAMGDQGQLETIEEVVQRLRESVAMSRADDERGVLRELRDEITMLRSEIAQLHMMNEQLRHTLNERERELAIVRDQLQAMLASEPKRSDDQRPRR